MSLSEQIYVVGLAALLGGAAFLAQSPAGDESALGGFENELKTIAERAQSSVVTIAAYVRDGTAPEDTAPPTWVRQPDLEYLGFRRIGSGSGIVVSADGDILTNRHFLVQPDGTPADLIDVETADMRHTLSTIVGMEPTLNLAVVRLTVFSEHNPPSFAPVEFGDSAALAPGSLALALGDPFGPERYFGLGVVAALPNRQCYQEQLTATYLQIATQVPTGAYGGGVLDSSGRYVGMLTPRDAKPGVDDNEGDRALEYALPSDVVRGIYATIKETGSMRSPWLGVAVMGVAELRAELGASGFGALVRPRSGIFVDNVFAGSPAHAAGVRVGDFLTHIDGTAVGTPLDFQRLLYLAGIGNALKVDLFRAGEAYSVELVVEVRPAEAIPR
jgi:S1-C subfamily serine protease